MESMDEKILEWKQQIKAGGTPPPAKEMLSQEEVSASIMEGALHMKYGTMEFEEIFIPEYALSTRLPKGFALMPEPVARAKYPFESRPKYIYSDPAYDTSLGFQYTPQPLQDDEVEAAKDAMLDMMTKFQPSNVWIDNGVKQVNDKTIGYLLFLSPALDGKVFNLVYLTAWRGKGLVCNFNCREQERRIWKPIAMGLMESLKEIQK
ncbi:hypothetical protein SAMN04487970_10623 [Paenibacillus tianmuensis]|uniref:Uncharacterized protein n=1 Tax=Paenibacillus tianmuensis TaxID=624147 RepID=A0A1G4TQH2_9BACL|nr:hypothetical protein [Paenibacillus tianmuensis]SCW83624.1 hypothetical protein SAMN04487970_10623 [Paenibacillus tianmuensis]